MVVLITEFAHARIIITNRAIRGKGIFIGIFQDSMAKLAAETITEEELEAKRSSRARAMAK
jgi:hypothetical protein